MRKLVTAALLLAAASPVHAAGTFYDRYVIGADGIPPCYARTYTGEHLAEHPRQKVTEFFLTGSAVDDGRPPRSFTMDFGFRLKGSSDVFGAVAVCAARGDGATCLVEGDGGGFTLTPRPDGLLVTVEERLEVEGAESFSPDLHDSDDREFRLYASAPEVCVFNAFGGEGADQEAGVESLTPSIERP
jgi:hypothetical protein